VSKIEIIERIKSVVSRNIRDQYEYKLFLFGQNLYAGEHPEFIDIGIDCDGQLDPVLKLKILDELDEMDSHNMLLIDFSKINNDLKSRIFKNCEFIN
jgi:hypothetical protein